MRLSQDELTYSTPSGMSICQSVAMPMSSRRTAANGINAALFFAYPDPYLVKKSQLNTSAAYSTYCFSSLSLISISSSHNLYNYIRVPFLLHTLLLYFTTGMTKSVDPPEGIKKVQKANSTPKASVLGLKRASRVTEQEELDYLKMTPKPLDSSPPPEVLIPPSAVYTILSSPQRELAKAECILAAQKYHLAVHLCHNVPKGGGLTTAQRKKFLAELTPPERYLELSRPVPAVRSEDLRVRPIGEGIVLASSAMQMLSVPSIQSAQSIETACLDSTSDNLPLSSSCSSSSWSRSRVESAALYSTGCILQLSGDGAFNAEWLPVVTGHEKSDTPHDTKLSPLPPLLTPSAALLSSESNDNMEVSKSKGEALKDQDGSECVTTSHAAVQARVDLSTHVMQALGVGKFEVAASGASALVSAYGCRLASTAACWLLQLQR